MRIRIAVGGLLTLPLACEWEEFHACEGDECVTTTGSSTTSTTNAGGAAGAAGSAGVGVGAGAGAGAGGGPAGGTDTGGATTATTGGAGSTGSGGEGGDPGAGGTAGAGGSPPLCDGELLPGDDACVVDEDYGVFVSPSGDDVMGKGTREAPFATLQRAADRARGSGKRVYACATAGDYVEQLDLIAVHDRLELFGSLDCSDWTYAPELRANVAPELGLPLQIRSIPTRVELEGFSFESPDAIERGSSSIAARIRASSGVVLRNVALRAGAGAEGDPGESVSFDYPAQSELDGGDAYDTQGGEMTPVECPAGDTTQGGNGGWRLSAPRDGQNGIPDYEGIGGEGGVEGGSCVGRDGSDGPDGEDGAGATTRGALIDGIWVPAGGSPGGHGQPGQGGGGGAGASNGGGGGGGAGGCGRRGGTAGGGGGASIALLLLDAEVTLVDSEVVATDGGRGAPGGIGELRSQVVGNPGLGLNDGCDGGAGGRGGPGGGGGGGAGGISVGILFDGTAPGRTNTSVVAGIEGEGGGGGGADNDGVDGFSEPDFDVADL